MCHMSRKYIVDHLYIFDCYYIFDHLKFYIFNFSNTLIKQQSLVHMVPGPAGQ